jgi:hypothetical protein
MARSDRALYLYLRVAQSEFAFDEIIEHLRSHGICLEFPGSENVKVLSSEGDQFEKPRQWLLQAIRSTPSINFQWWVNDREDVYCRIRFDRPRTIVEFALDGMTNEQEVEFLKCAFGLLNVYLFQGILIGCVIDQLGVVPSSIDAVFV